MKKKQLIVAIIICLCPLTASAVTFDEMLSHKASASRPFWGDYYKNIKWTSHIPYMEHEVIDLNEADYRGQTDIGLIDVDGDGKDEIIKVIWGTGVSDHMLTIELYNTEGKFAAMETTGIQSNFRVEDTDNDGMFEVIIWGAVSDPSMTQLFDEATEEKPFEAHSVPHLFEVAIYKLKDSKYELIDKYTSKNKYEPFCKEQPE